jgi:hypothetical protein
VYSYDFQIVIVSFVLGQRAVCTSRTAVPNDSAHFAWCDLRAVRFAISMQQAPMAGSQYIAGLSLGLEGLVCAIAVRAYVGPLLDHSCEIIVVRLVKLFLRH